MTQYIILRDTFGDGLETFVDIELDVVRSKEELPVYVNDAFGTATNPLGTYDTAVFDTPRGAYVINIEDNPVGTANNQQVTAIVNLNFTEPILLPPFLFKKIDEEAA